MWEIEEPLIYTLANGGRLKIPKSILEQFSLFVQKEPHIPESGGVLLGRFIKGTNDIVLDAMTVPEESDTQERCFFRREKEPHQTMIDTYWKRTKGTGHYLGEWHTHPENYPQPSSTDYRNWIQLLQVASYYGTTLIYIIIGIKEIVVYQGSNKNLSIQKLQLWQPKPTKDL